MADGTNEGGPAGAAPGLGSSSSTPHPPGKSAPMPGDANKNRPSPDTGPKEGIEGKQQRGSSGPNSGARSSGTG
eukprot:8539754-Heterocapsa_arctica.AAC.1